MRLDIYLSKNHLAKSRTYAQDAIKEGRVSVNGKTVLKASFDVSEEDEITLLSKEIEFVSRGGLKLYGALQDFEIDVTDKIVADIGASSGGFTDCVLSKNAKKVYSIDVGTLQLSNSLKNHPRVVSMENTNALDLTPDHFHEMIDLVVMDVSFISVTALLGHLIELFPKAEFVVLIKPQFEAGKKFIGKNGIVKDKKVHLHVLNQIVQFLAQKHATIFKMSKCQISGKDGNQEYFVYFTPGLTETSFRLNQMEKLVK